MEECSLLESEASVTNTATSLFDKDADLLVLTVPSVAKTTWQEYPFDNTPFDIEYLLRCQLFRMNEKLALGKERIEFLENRAFVGVSRHNLMSDLWHVRNPESAHYFFGLGTWSETKAYIHALFWLDASSGEADDPLTDFEKLLVAKMRMHKRLQTYALGRIWGKDRVWIGKICNQAARMWGEAGEDLSKLDISPGYLRYECPEDYKNPLLGLIGVLPDGKSFMTDVARTSFLIRAQYDNKTHHAAALQMNYSTPAGLSVEHSPLVFARGTEHQVTKRLGAVRGLTPVVGLPAEIIHSYDDMVRLEFRDREQAIVPRQDDLTERDEDFSEALGMLGFGESLLDPRGNPINQSPERIDALGNPLDRLAPEEKDAERMPHVTGSELLDEMLRFTKELLQPAGHDVAKRIRRAEYALKLEEVEKALQLAILSGPDQSPYRKYRQLQRHQRLHVLYRTGVLKPCMLSYYLDFWTDVRLQQMEGLLVVGNLEFPRFKIGLGKFPAEYGVLGDKGFAEDAILWENLNPHITPTFLRGRLQFTMDQARSDLLLKKLRYTPETCFSHETDEEGLRDVIPYSFFGIMDHIANWGLAKSNLCIPFRSPLTWLTYLERRWYDINYEFEREIPLSIPQLEKLLNFRLAPGTHVLSPVSVEELSQYIFSGCKRLTKAVLAEYKLVAA